MTSSTALPASHRAILSYRWTLWRHTQNTPTFREQGADAVFGNWRGVVASKGLKDDKFLAQEYETLRRVLTDLGLGK